MTVLATFFYCYNYF